MTASTLEFLAVSRPGGAVCLTWLPPAGNVTEYIVYATRHPFPPELTPELFAGRMGAHVRETALAADVHEHRVDAAEHYYAVAAVVDDGRRIPAADVKEVSATAPPRLDSVAAVQCRTFLRARWVPRPIRGRAAEVAVYVRDDAPEDDELAAMLSGAVAPDHRLDPHGDGFVDTATPRDFRKYYVAVLVCADGSRRPLRLSMSGFQRLEAPVYLSKDGPALQKELVDAVAAQIASDLRSRDTDDTEIRAMLDRAHDLAPGHEELLRLEIKARERLLKGQAS